MQQRIQKIIAASGIVSRRKAEVLIQEGRVKVNGKVASIGESADAEKDTILVDNNPLPKERRRYILLYKPCDFVTSVSDPYEKNLVTDLVDVPERVFPVGRLDKDTEGLLILTNDGEFANKVMHPRYEVRKTYIAHLTDRIDQESLEKLRNGVFIEGRKVKAHAYRLNPGTVEVTLHEGRHKIVKRLFKRLGNYVRHLKRTKIGTITAKGLKPGQWRELTAEERQSLTTEKKQNY